MRSLLLLCLLLVAIFVLAEPSFALNFGYFTAHELTFLHERNRFYYGDTLDGPVRSNDTIAVWSGPVFHDFFITTAPQIWYTQGNEPQSDLAVVYSAPRLELPQRADTIRLLAMFQGHFFAANDSMQAKVLLGNHSLRIWWWLRGILEPDSMNYVDYPLPDSAVVFFQVPELRLSGVLHSVLILGCSGMIGLEDDIVYASSGPLGQLAPHHPEKLALIAENDIKILNTIANGRGNSGITPPASGLTQPNQARTSININGLLFALGESITFAQQNDPDSGYVFQGAPDDRGTINLSGATVMKRRNYYHRSTRTSTGYLKNFHYDRELKFWNVPLFNARENELQPTHLDFNRAGLNQAVVETVRVFNDYVPIRLDSLRIAPPFFVQDTARVDSYQWVQTFTVRFQSQVVGDYRDTLRMKSNYYNQWFSVPLSGSARDLATDPTFVPHPSSFTLSAFPNPFNVQTRIVFALPKAGYAALTVYDLRGRTVAVLADSRLETGEHAVQWDATNVATGVYFLSLRSADKVAVQKLLLLK